MPSKTGHYDESMKLHSTWMSSWIVPVLEQLLGSRGPAEKLWGFEHADFVRAYRDACSELGFVRLRLTTALYGLRHGGASHDTVGGLRTFPEIKERGRWATDASVHRYRKASLAQAEQARIPAQLLSVAGLISKDVGMLFEDTLRRKWALRRLSHAL